MGELIAHTLALYRCVPGELHAIFEPKNVKKHVFSLKFFRNLFGSVGEKNVYWEVPWFEKRS